MVDKKNKIDDSNKGNDASGRFKAVLIFIAIVVVLVSFVTYGINVFYPEPDYWSECENVEYQIEVENCDNVTSSNDIDMKPSMRNCYCNEYDGKCTMTNPERQICESASNSARDSYEFVIFIIMSIIGAGLIFSSIFIKNNVLSNSILASGIIILFIGIVRSWNDFGEVVRFIILGVILAALVYISIKKLGDK